MRCYHLCNMYLIGIHAGIQAAHTQHELAIKYLASTPYRNMVADESLDEYGVRLDLHLDAKASYIDWANNHKTMILLNGGMMSHLVEFENFLADNEHTYAWSSFREEDAAIAGALTNVGLVLPEDMYRWNRQILKFVNSPDAGFTSRDEDCTDDIVCIERTGVTKKERIELTVDHAKDGSVKVYFYNQFDIELMKRLDRLKLM